jgi:hypothetical protein
VRAALKELASALEEGKADVLGLFMVEELSKRGELDEPDVADNYVTFIASIFRSVRFGAASAHGRANLVQLNYLQEKGAFVYDEASGTYRVDLEKMKPAVEELARAVLKLQGDGDYEGLSRFNERYEVEGENLRRSLARLEGKGIPVDIVFEQGAEVLGLEGS